MFGLLLPGLQSVFVLVFLVCNFWLFLFLYWFAIWLCTGLQSVFFLVRIFWGFAISGCFCFFLVCNLFFSLVFILFCYRRLLSVLLFFFSGLQFLVVSGCLVFGFYGSWFSGFWFYDFCFLVFWFMLSFFGSGSGSGSGSLKLSLYFLAGAGISEGSAAGPTFHRRLSSWLNHEPNFECMCLMLAPI